MMYVDILTSVVYSISYPISCVSDVPGFVPPLPTRLPRYLLGLILLSSEVPPRYLQEG